jgi:Predicted acetyltransferase involved in intracellular survival and related acetyltransferases
MIKLQLFSSIVYGLFVCFFRKSSNFTVNQTVCNQNRKDMNKCEIKEQLRIKPVGVKYLDQYNELLKYVFQVTDRQISESGYKAGELKRTKRPVLQQADVYGWFTPEDELVSQLSIYPCHVNIHGKIMDMGAVTGVGTYPEYANMGLMNDLIRLALEKMRDHKQFISYLYPYSIPYYRRKGWEIMSDHMTFSIRDIQIPKVVNVSGHVERLEVTDEDVLDVYDRYARSNHGALIRTKLEWDEYWRWENEDERTAAVYYDAENIPSGYILYWVENDEFRIKEMIYLNQDARHGLWNFIKAHFSMIDVVKGDLYTNEPISFLLEDSRIDETIEPYYMARIVDVEEFLKIYPFEEGIKPFHFIVSDPVVDRNNGTVGVRMNEEGTLLVTREAVGASVTLDIQTLTTMLMSYKRPAYLYKTERLKTDRQTIRLLEEIIPDQQPYFSDYF